MIARPNSTKRELRIGGLALLVVAALGSTAVTEEKFQKLTGGYIRARFGGMELTDNVHWRDLYQRNGTVMSTSMGRKRAGRWRVEQDQLCIELEGEPIPKMLRRMDLRKRGRAAKRRPVAVAGYPRAGERTQLVPGTRSSHTPCGKCGRELRVQKGH